MNRVQIKLKKIHYREKNQPVKSWFFETTLKQYRQTCHKINQDKKKQVEKKQY